MHWSTVGDIRAPDRVILEWAREHHYVVFTHDLDFGALLTLTNARGPSVIQARTLDVMPAALASPLIAAIREHASSLERGAILTLDPHRNRVRVLPLNPSESAD
jgi:predicted nuclease of predicted toxin-antitoxin system